MTTSPADYRAFLLRLWRTSSAEWRAALEDAHTGERLAFASVEQLTAFLLREIGSAAPAHPPRPAISPGEEAEA